MPQHEPAIAVERVSKTFRESSSRPVLALDGLSLRVARGEIFGLLGRNGAGKTTLLRILTTLIRPTAGTASVLGLDVVRHPYDVRKQICVVLQENAVELYLTVRANLAMYARFHSVPRAEIKPRADRAIEQFGLGPYRDQTVIDLSAGLKRRVQVAKVFMVDKPVVFLDEATTGMDPINKRAALDAIREQARLGRTIFLTTQILSEAEELCNTIAMIDRGKIVASGDLRTLKSLASDTVRITMTFDKLTLRLLRALRSLPVLTMSHEHDTVWMSLKGSGPEALDIIMAAVPRKKILHFELTSATLEDVFFRLLGDKAPAEDAP
jgi:ABC-2 type transport system ATP-binding protein